MGLDAGAAKHLRTLAGPISGVTNNRPIPRRAPLACAAAEISHVRGQSPHKLLRGARAGGVGRAVAILVAVTLPSSLAGSRSAPRGPRYTVAPLTVQPPVTFAADTLSKRGQVLGRLTFPATGASGERWHPALWQNGAVTDLGTLGGDQSDGYAINDREEVVGFSSRPDGGEYAFVWRRSRMEAISTLDGTRGTAVGINNTGEIIGYTSVSGCDTRSWLWKDGKAVDLGSLGTGFAGFRRHSERCPSVSARVLG
jgi:probable HAF family extracellular repeat protein